MPKVATSPRGRVYRGRALYWRELISDWSSSGLSQAEFCRRRGVSAGTFAWWKREIRLRSSAPSPTTTTPGRRGRLRELTLSVTFDRPRFVSVKVRPVATPVIADSSTPIEIVLAGSRRVRVGAGFDADTFEKVVKLLESLPC